MTIIIDHTVDWKLVQGWDVNIIGNFKFHLTCGNKVKILFETLQIIFNKFIPAGFDLFLNNSCLDLFLLIVIFLFIRVLGCVL